MAGVVDGATVVLVAGTAVTVVVGPFGPVVPAKCVVGTVMKVVDVMGCRTATYICTVVVVLTGLVLVVSAVVGTVLVGSGLVVVVAGAAVVVGKTRVGTSVLGTGAVDGTDALVVLPLGLEVVALVVDLPRRWSWSSPAYYGAGLAPPGPSLPGRVRCRGERPAALSWRAPSCSWPPSKSPLTSSRRTAQDEAGP